MKRTISNTKHLMIALISMLTFTATGNAMSYEQARNEALFLTDKMAYELNLTDEQYEAAYEINLDYLMGVTSYDDVYSTYWERRNLDMSYILFDWQWNAFRAATYFYRPLYWRDGFWHFGIYARYPHRDYFYFGRPVFYASYRGGHAWHAVGGHGYYYARRDHYRPAPTAGRSHFGMLDRWNRGDFRNHQVHDARSRAHFGGNRNSSTRTTVNGNRGFGNNNHGTYRHQESFGNTHKHNTTPSTTTPQNNRRFGSGRSNSYGESHSNRNTSFGSGASRSSNSSNTTFGSGASRSNGSNASFGSGISRSSHSSGSGSSHSSGGRSFGGRR